MLSPHEVCKVLVVDPEGNVLGIRRSETDTRRPGQWDFPGGWREDPKEEPADTAAREVKEETGLVVESPEEVFSITETTPQGECTWRLFVAHAVGDLTVNLGDEHSREHDLHRWFEPSELLSELKYERHQRMLSFAIENGLLGQ